MQKLLTLREVRSLFYFLLLAVLLLFATQSNAQVFGITVKAVPNVTINCSDAMPTIKPTATTTCKKTGDFVYTYIDNTSGICPKVTIRTWTITDACGNKLKTTNKITVVDKKAPEISGVPANITVSCNEIPPFAKVTAQDACGGKVQLFQRDIKQQALCDNNYVIRREYSASDLCGNIATKTQFITVQDKIAPVFLSKPTDVTLTCSELDAPILALEASDNCTPNFAIKVSWKDNLIKGSCEDNYEIKRTWTAKDLCGNSTSFVQSITVKDDKKPTFIDAKDNTFTWECQLDLFLLEPKILKATDNCDKDVEVVFKQETKPGNCPGNYTVIRTWTASDNCANKTSVSDIITVKDTQAPFFTNDVQDVTLSCTEVSTTPPQVLAYDQCSLQSSTVKYDAKTSVDGCKGIITRTWTATDACGNSAVKTQKVTLVDTKAPVFSPNVVDMTVSCNEIPAETVLPPVTDNCDRQVKITLDSKSSLVGCRTLITRTWTATDACGNIAVKTQKITVADIKSPVFAGNIVDMTVSCNEIPAETLQPTVSDNCDKQPKVVYETKTTTDGCKVLITRTWRATDACGNLAVKTQKISVIDTKAPVFDPIIALVTVECGKTAVLPTIIAKDNCDANVNIKIKEDVLANTPGTNPCNSIVVRTWTASDKCNNTAIISQAVYIYDTKPPVFVNTPLPLTIDCGNLSNIVNPIALDDCTKQIKYSFKDALFSISDDSCDLKIMRTWTAEDLCGNKTTAQQPIVIADNTAPSPSVLPVDVTLSCSDTIPPKQIITFSDNCDKSVVVGYVETVSDSITLNGFLQSYLLKREWIATDQCGNVRAVTQLITVSSLDFKAPLFLPTTLPQDIILQCKDPNLSSILYSPVFPKAIDDCDNKPVVTYEDDKVFEQCGKHSYILLRKWIATDKSGNSEDYQQFISVEDNQPPAIYNVPKDITLACGTALPVVPTNIFAIDTCGAKSLDEHPAVSYYQKEYAGTCNGLSRIIRYWTAVDSCENVITLSQKITFVTSPTLNKSEANQKNILLEEENIETIAEEIPSIKVFPNPNSGTVYVTLPTHAQSMKLMDNLGRTLLQVAKPKEGINSIEMSQWENGIYFIQCRTGNQIISQKIILQKQ
jgi:large repetitive protein